MNVLCVVAHPDDEVLGCGGTLAKHAENGDDVSLIILARQSLRMTALSAAITILGSPEQVTEMCHADFPDQQFETVPFTGLVAEIRDFCERRAVCPDIIYTHHPGDLNLDHALTARGVLTAFRPKPGEKPRTILACEVLSSTEWTFPQVFQPNWFEALTLYQVNRKQMALRKYPTEEMQLPHPRSWGGIYNAARFRGQQCGVEYAEAFQLLRRGPC